MNKESTNALQQLTGKMHLDDVSVEELQQLAEAHPYFAAAHLLLLQKMHQSQDAGLQKQAYKTALFFPNQQWLHYFLFDKIEEPSTDTIQDDIPVFDNEERIASSKKVFESEAFVTETETSTEEQIEITRQPEEDANLITLPVGQILEDVADTDAIRREPEEFPLDDEELQQQSEPLPIEESNQKIANLLSGQAEEFNKPVEEKAEVTIDSEPFHTVDYFASQGIRLDAKREDNSFDRKVHKFTDWLRQMKRINPHPIDLGTEEDEETYVATIADSSNHTKEIVTESMAEVLSKQGKSEKAVEIYQKLSLLNPDKTTYFAGLIQKLK